MPMGFTLLLALAAWLAPVHDRIANASYLYVRSESADGSEQVEPTLYSPQAGDLVLFRNGNWFYRVAFRLTLTGPPTHIGIVVALPDGTHAVLETVDRRTGVRLMAMPNRLQTYSGTVWVRRIRRPLTEEQNAILTEFAVEQEGKKYASHRLILPAICPLLRSRLLAWLRPDKDFQQRRSWFCSELVAAACVKMGLFPPSRIRPWCTFPLDFYCDDLLDLSADWEPPFEWGQDPTARPRE